MPPPHKRLETERGPIGRKWGGKRALSQSLPWHARYMRACRFSATLSRFPPDRRRQHNGARDEQMTGRSAPQAIGRPTHSEHASKAHWTWLPHREKGDRDARRGRILDLVQTRPAVAAFGAAAETGRCWPATAASGPQGGRGAEEPTAPQSGTARRKPGGGRAGSEQSQGAGPRRPSGLSAGIGGRTGSRAGQAGAGGKGLRALHDTGSEAGRWARAARREASAACCKAGRARP